MKKVEITLALVITGLMALTFAPRQAFAQADEVSYINELGKKKVATVNDGLNLYELVVDKKPFFGRVDPKNNVPLKKGFIAYIVANNLKLSDSLLFRIFNTHRYAFRVCVAHDLLSGDASENDLMSGEELIEFMRLTSEYKERGVTK